MKFIHLSDLHIGKRLHEASLIDDQRYILDKIIEIISAENPDGVIIAGDIYDKAMPSAEAVELFDDFLCRLSLLDTKVFIISGNHDSPERIAFGGRIMMKSQIYLSPVYNGALTRVEMSDDYGALNVYMLPFVRPADVRRFFPEQKITSYTDAVTAAVNASDINADERNIIITHQLVTGASRSDSEDISVGGTDNVDISAFEKFDYAALGHIHGPQNIGSEKIRYCGTPLKYSFSESAHKKSVTAVEFYEKGNMKIREIPLTPKRDMRKIKGGFDELIKLDKTDDYCKITLTDEDEIIGAVDKLRFIFPNLLELDYDNRRTRSTYEFTEAENNIEKDPLTVFAEFYEKQNGAPMTDQQKDIVWDIILKLTEEQ